MNLLLEQQGYPFALRQPEDRTAYLASLEQAQLGGSLEPYYEIISLAVERSFDIYLQSIQDSC